MPPRRCVLALFAAATTSSLTGAAALGTPRAALAANTAYAMAYFTESPQMRGANYGLHLAVSTDGLNWTPLNQNNPVVTPTAGTLGLRDPFAFRKQDGTFVDQLWRMVPGVADSAGVSFQSVNFPTRYLRHSNYAIRLDTNDNTTTFRTDATFYRVAGLADAAWSSFRSYNFPDRYLRHANYLLRIDPLSASSSATDRQDATFRVTS